MDCKTEIFSDCQADWMNGDIEDVTDSPNTKLFKAKSIIEEKAALSSQLADQKFENEESMKILKLLNEEKGKFRCEIETLKKKLKRVKVWSRREEHVQELLEVFLGSVCPVDKLRSTESLLKKEQSLNALLKANVESLMQETSQHMNRIHALEKQNEALLKEVEEFRKKTHVEKTSEERTTMVFHEPLMRKYLNKEQRDIVT